MALKAFKTQKKLHHCHTTFEVFNAEKKHSVTSSRLLKFLPLKKGSITSLRLKGFNFEEWLHHILMALKVF